MSKLFRNYDKEAIKVLMKEIGAYRYERALENMKMSDQKPISMSGFYLESNEHCIFLCHRYPSGYVLKLMKVDGFMQIPKEGWKLIKEKRYL
ncbi:hypothetical protein ACFSQJ_19330 [Croceitalea marina]|uniref:Uncharacterized protein n=1 Tax=Croceitalea marina TaxID=1775166 RepID=A0ABW5N1X9_9FLAO